MDITIRVESFSRRPNRDRLDRADRYVERANQSIDTRQRDAFLAEADRIYREEGGE